MAKFYGAKTRVMTGFPLTNVPYEGYSMNIVNDKLCLLIHTRQEGLGVDLDQEQALTLWAMLGNHLRVLAGETSREELDDLMA